MVSVGGSTGAGFCVEAGLVGVLELVVLDGVLGLEEDVELATLDDDGVVLVVGVLSSSLLDCEGAVMAQSTIRVTEAIAMRDHFVETLFLSW